MTYVEQVLAATLAALEGVPGAQLVERNRESQVPDGVTPALVLYDEGLEGLTDRPQAGSRDPTFRMELGPVVWGYVEGPHSTVGTARTQLFGDTVKAVWTNPALNALLASREGGIALDGTLFPPPGKGADTSAAAFVMQLRLSFLFDPKNP